MHDLLYSTEYIPNYVLVNLLSADVVCPRVNKLEFEGVYGWRALLSTGSVRILSTMAQLGLLSTPKSDVVPLSYSFI